MGAIATPVPVSERVYSIFGKFVGEVNLNLGCGRTPEKGFINLDRVGDCGADIVFDLERCADGRSFPGAPGVPYDALHDRLADHCVDFVLASHVLEHITGLIPLMREIHRVLKPSGHLAVVCPYASSDDAWEDPTHVRAFTERSWHYFDRRLYERGNHAGSYPSPIDFCFDVAGVHLVPYPDLTGGAASAIIGAKAADFEVRKRFFRNVVREMHAVLRKVEG